MDPNKPIVPAEELKKHIHELFDRLEAKTKLPILTMAVHTVRQLVDQELELLLKSPD